MIFFLGVFITILATTTFAQNNCPTYSAPLCAADEKVILNKDSSGCDGPVCAKKNLTSCPVYSMPLCTSGEVVLLQYKDGCSSPVCSHMKGVTFNSDVPVEPGSGPVVYTNKTECLDDLIALAGKSYKLLNKDTIAHVSNDGTVDILRSNYKISKSYSNGSCSNDSTHILQGYNSVLMTAYQKAKKVMASRKGGPNPESDAITACDNQENHSDWWREAQVDFVPGEKANTKASK